MSVPNLSSLQPAVFDSGPLIYLDSLGYAELLPELNRVLAPPAVLRELAARPDEPGGRLPGRTWLEHEVPEPEYVNRVGKEPPTLGEGEKETIALALQLGALAVLDDLRARRRARLLGVGLTGTLGVLLRLHRLGLADRDLTSDLASLEGAGMYFSEAVRDAVLKAKED